MLRIRRYSHLFFFFLAVYYHRIFASAITRRSCDTVDCPGDWDLWPAVGSVLDSTGAALDWLLPESVKTPTDTPKQTQPDVELMVTSPPVKECDVVALPGSTDAQNVSVKSRFVYFADQFFRFMKLMKAGFFCMYYRDSGILAHAKMVLRIRFGQMIVQIKRKIKPRRI